MGDGPPRRRRRPGEGLVPLGEQPALARVHLPEDPFGQEEGVHGLTVRHHRTQAVLEDPGELGPEVRVEGGPASLAIEQLGRYPELGGSRRRRRPCVEQRGHVRHVTEGQ